MAWQPPFLGPICPDCGAPLRSAASGCKHCGFSPHEPKETHEGIMTAFGYGFCGVGIGLLLAMMLNFAAPSSSPLETVGFGFLLVVVLGRITSWIGQRLAPGLRCTYEHLLLSTLLGGVASFVTAVAVPLPLETYGYIWLGGAVVSYLFIRRYGYHNSR